MLNQKLIEDFGAFEPPTIAAGMMPISNEIIPDVGLMERARTISHAHGAGGLTLLAAEHIANHIVELPKASARQQAAMIQFAVEDMIAEPLENVVVSKGPTNRTSQSVQMAFVTSKAIMDRYANVTGLFPEFLMIPPPQLDGTWHVWRTDDRAVVRASDGEGFAASMTLLYVIWQSVGRPQVYSLCASMPPEYAAIDLSAAPPAPLHSDLAFRFSSDHARETKGLIRTALFAGSVILAAAVTHLAIFAFETWALREQVNTARSQAQSAISQSLPDITLDTDVSAILSLLAPTAATARRGDFLPLLADVSGVISVTPVSTDTPVSFRRLAWGAQDNKLVLFVQTGGLEDLQRIQQGLQSSSFIVTTGAATASEGGAEAEIRIRREGSQ